MPKVPQILSTGESGGLPQGARLSPGGFAELSTSGIRTGAKELNDAQRQYEHAYTTLRAENEKLDAEQALGEAQRQFADAQIGIQNDPNITPEQYPQEVSRQLKTIREGVGKTLRYPASRQLFERGMMHFETQKTVEAKYEGLKMMHADVKSTTDLLLREDANQAVFGPTPEAQEAGLRRGLDRIQNLGRTRVLSGDEMNARTNAFMKHVETGKIMADARNPELRPILIQRLVSGNFYTTMDPDTQLTMAKQIQDQSDHEAKQLQEAQDKWFKDRQKEQVSDLFAQASRGELSPVVLEQKRKDWRLSREDVAAIQTEMTKPAVEGPSDTATLDRVDADVHSATPTMTEATLNALRRQNLLNRKDYLNAKDKLVSRTEANRKEGQSLQMQRHNQAEQEGRAAFEIPAMYDRLEGNKGKVWSAFLRELDARSNAFKGQEDPLAVAKEIIPRYRQQLGDEARMEATQIEGLLVYKTLPELKAALASGAINQGQYVAQEQLLIDLNEARAIQDRNDANAQKAQAERDKKKAEQSQSIFRRLLPTFGAPPANATTTGKEKK